MHGTATELVGETKSINIVFRDHLVLDNQKQQVYNKVMAGLDTLLQTYNRLDPNHEEYYNSRANQSGCYINGAKIHFCDLHGQMTPYD